MLKELGIDHVIFKADVYGNIVPGSNSEDMIRQQLGEIYSCCLGAQPGETNGVLFGDVKGEIKRGNQNPLTSIWNATTEIRKGLMKGANCTSCNHTDREINKAYISFQDNASSLGQ